MATVTLAQRPSGSRKPRRSAVMALALSLALFLMLPALPAKGGSSTWKAEPIDSPRGFGSLTHDALAVDGDAGFHLVYGGRHLYYAYRPSGENAWRFETADDAPNVGGGAAIALDDAGLPHISYCAALGTGIRYAFRDVAGWHVETVYAQPEPELAAAGDDLGQAKAELVNSRAEPEAGGGTPCITSLAVGDDGSVHIAFLPNAPGHGLKYAFRDAAGWHVSTLDPGDFAGGEPSLTLDSQGYPRVSYYGGYPYYDLRYAYRDAIGWYTLTLSHGGDAGLFSSMAVDDHDRSHIAYYEAYTGDLMYIRLEGDQREMEPVDTEGNVGQYASLVLDSNGEPYISYYAAEPAAAVKLAHRDAAGWHAETVLSLGSMMGIIGDTAVALDPSGAPQVAWFDTGIQVLHLFWPGPAGVWQGGVVDRGGTAGDNSSLKLDAQGYPHISYYAGYLWRGPFFGHLKHAWQDAAGWHEETVDIAHDPGRGSSLQVDGTGGLHISYLARSPAAQVLYTQKDADGWHPETVDQEVYSVGPTSLALDTNGRPQISYVADNALRHAYRDSLGWQLEVVDQGTPGWCETPQASLALDTNGRPHIAYSLCSPAELRYAWRDETGWHFEVVDTDGDTGRYNSLALGVDGSPRIAYYAGYPYHELRYAWRDAVGWHREVAFGGGDVGLYPSLVLDDAGRPHISFLGYLPDRSAMSLGLAERVSTGWSIMVGLYTGIDMRPGTSLALDAAGLPMVSFSGDGGLRFGYFVPWQMRYLPLVFRQP